MLKALVREQREFAPGSIMKWFHNSPEERIRATSALTSVQYFSGGNGEVVHHTQGKGMSSAVSEDGRGKKLPLTKSI